MLPYYAVLVLHVVRRFDIFMPLAFSQGPLIELTLKVIIYVMNAKETHCYPVYNVRGLFLSRPGTMGNHLARIPFFD